MTRPQPISSVIKPYVLVSNSNPERGFGYDVRFGKLPLFGDVCICYLLLEIFCISYSLNLTWERLSVCVLGGWTGGMS